MTEGPLTEFAIHRKTRLHRTYVLPRSLLNLENNGTITKNIGQNNRYYYTLNWENKDAKTFYHTYIAKFLMSDMNKYVTRENEERQQIVNKLNELANTPPPQQ